VVVREQEGVSITTRDDAPLPVLRIEGPAVPTDELPDLADSWAWAHVQSRVPAAGVAAAVAASTGEVIARMVCPRRLVPGAAWRACLVPAFDAGVARGLGQEPADSTELQPAWSLDGIGASIELPVYCQWRFTTGPSGDFEALCRRLQPDGGSAELGLHAMEVGDPGLLAPAAGSVLVDMEGALETLGAQPRPWDSDSFQSEIVDLLDEAVARAEVTPVPPGKSYDPLASDPVVGPPLYGAGPAGVTAVPDKGWVRLLNDDPSRRGAAGLGAAVVRANQEVLVAAAWDQAGEVRATVSALNHARLALEVGRSWTRRAVTLDDADLLQATGRLHAFLPSGDRTVRARLAGSAVPGGLVSSAYARQTRPSTPLARDWRTRTNEPAARLSAEHLERTLLATRRGASTTSLDFALVGLPKGAQVTDPTLDTPPEQPKIEDADPALLDEIRRRAGLPQVPPVTSEPHEAARRSVAPLVVQTQDVSGLAGDVRAVLDPAAAVRASIVLRIPALENELEPGALPTTVALGPIFSDPLSLDLVALRSSWLLPGAETIARNRVRLVSENPTFVGAFLIGANGGLGQELLWRGYPVDLRATFFHRFWSYVDPGRNDIDELMAWGGPKRLGNSIRENMQATTAISTVIVVRGDLVRRYPTASYYLQAAARKGKQVVPVDGDVQAPIFYGALDRDTVFFGFDEDPDTVRGDGTARSPGYYLAIEEQAGAPRFGLDEAEPGDYGNFPATWDDLSWGHLVSSEDELEQLTHAPAELARLEQVPDDSATWGKNSANQARACWQRPFRMLIHAEELI
jgi:hypothetical protein